MPNAIRFFNGEAELDAQITIAPSTEHTADRGGANAPGRGFQVIARLQQGPFTLKQCNVIDGYDWLIEDVRAGGKSLVTEAGSVPGDIANQMPIEAWLNAVTLQAGQDFELQIVYVGTEDPRPSFACELYSQVRPIAASTRPIQEGQEGPPLSPDQQVALLSAWEKITGGSVATAEMAPARSGQRFVLPVRVSEQSVAPGERRQVKIDPLGEAGLKKIDTLFLGGAWQVHSLTSQGVTIENPSADPNRVRLDDFELDPLDVQLDVTNMGSAPADFRGAFLGIQP